MKKKNLYLIASILAFIVFIGFLGETEGKTMFGYPINVWVYRLVWLVLAVSAFRSYLRLKNAE